MLNIKDPEAHALATSLAKQTGETLTRGPSRHHGGECHIVIDREPASPTTSPRPLAACTCAVWAHS
jgi:hypothetical protein